MLGLMGLQIRLSIWKNLKIWKLVVRIDILGQRVEDVASIAAVQLAQTVACRREQEVIGMQQGPVSLQETLESV